MSNQNLPRYLYRALRPAEITAGIVLIPKARNLYLAERILPEVLPFDFVENPKSARQGHQRDSHQYPTSYVSTTPLLERAEYYATYSDPSREIVPSKIIVTIDTTTFDALGIVAHHVATEFTPDQISKPEDDEFILEYRGGHEFPKEIITNVEML
jgi:hypothetical protein